MEALRADDPAQVGPYALVGRLDAGELGQAYAGRHPAGPLVTVTVPYPHLAADPGFRDRFRADVGVTRRVAGPFVLPVDADTESPTPWLVTAGPDVPTLASAVTGGGPLPPYRIRELAVALTGALVGVREAGAALVGLEPSAVVMTPDGPRLSPFGITRLAHGDAGRSDPDAVWTLGAVLHFAATGRPPTAAPAGWQPGPPVVAEPVLAQLISDCLAASPTARPTLADLVGRLNATAVPGAVLLPPVRPRPWWRDVPASVVATAVGLAVIAVLVLSAGGSHDSFGAQPPGVAVSGIPGLPGTLPTDDGDGGDGGDGGDQPDGSQDPSDSPSATQDPIGTAATGDCFDDTGAPQTAGLRPTGCAPRTFKVVDVLHGTTDTGGCANVPEDSWNVPYPAQNLVLCLSYLYDHGSAYHAVPGDCVWGTSADSAWNGIDCQNGAFTVQKRYTGTTDGSRCNSLRDNDWVEHFTVGGRSDLDVTLCLTMNYPDDAGHATQHECMRFTGTTTRPSLHASSCGSANVVVTGRTPTYNNAKFCGTDAWATWKPDYYPKLAYTVCYRRR
ncbi:LppU/SCO3897 family protein [Streptomyces sp. NBC_01198]|uniref:LppU/SCO3897 family protein n=1 Tax=Streptomyces sp. NBC_01198 TaxID=2903769 RepID=UPI002E0E8E76|nr:hypothetical protein OG702_21735 [Streptomyces sp. NBC_01198]